MPEPSATLALFVGALALGVACLVLFIVAIRRMLGRHEDVVATMLQRYDHRLAEFAQTLSDALNQTLPARITAAISGAPPESPAIEGPDHSNVVRVLELAREQTSADAALAIVGTKSEPILATVGLSQAEVTQVGGLSVPDYRGARAIQVSFNADDAPNGGTPPIRSGLAVPLLDSSTEPGMLAVLTRTPDRRFSELDITSLENVLSISRPALESSLEAREPDPVPERDPLTDLYDRPAFHALLDLEIDPGARTPRAARVAHARRRPLDDDQRPHRPSRRRRRACRGGTRGERGRKPARPPVSGRRWAFRRRSSRRETAETPRRSSKGCSPRSSERPLPNVGVVSFSGGVAELLSNDDATALIVRADAALGLAKSSGRDMVVTAAKRPSREVA